MPLLSHLWLLQWLNVPLITESNHSPASKPPTAQARLAYHSFTSKTEGDILTGTSLQGGCRATSTRLQYQHYENDSQLTKHKSVTGKLPSGVIGKLHGIHIDVLMAIWAHRLYDPPADLITWFLKDRGHMKSRLINLCQATVSHVCFSNACSVVLNSNLSLAL